jgi:hypothetical protein
LKVRLVHDGQALQKLQGFFGLLGLKEHQRQPTAGDEIFGRKQEGLTEGAFRFTPFAPQRQHFPRKDPCGRVMGKLFGGSQGVQARRHGMPQMPMRPRKLHPNESIFAQNNQCLFQPLGGFLVASPPKGENA